MKQSEIAKECADWIRKKVEVKAYDEEYPIPQKLFVMENKREENSYINGSSDFTSSGLGFVPSNKPEMNMFIRGNDFTAQNGQSF